MVSSTSDIKNINLRDLEFDNKRWKNQLDYLIREIQIHQHHIECYRNEAQDSIMEPLIKESLRELQTHLTQAERLKKRVLIQEEEIPLCIKDFPINIQHNLWVEHQNLSKAVNAIFFHGQERLDMIRLSLTKIFTL